MKKRKNTHDRAARGKLEAEAPEPKVDPSPARVLGPPPAAPSSSPAPPAALPPARGPPCSRGCLHAGRLAFGVWGGGGNRGAVPRLFFNAQPKPIPNTFPTPTPTRRPPGGVSSWRYPKGRSCSAAAKIAATAPAASRESAREARETLSAVTRGALGFGGGPFARFAALE